MKIESCVSDAHSRGCGPDSQVLKRCELAAETIHDSERHVSATVQSGVQDKGDESNTAKFCPCQFPGELVFGCNPCR